MNDPLHARRLRPSPAAFALAIAWAASPAPSSAAPPGVIHHQGRMVVDGVNHDGPGFFKFSLVANAGISGEAVLWHHDGTDLALAEPAGALEVAVSAGHYSVALGEVTDPLGADLFAAHGHVSLRVWFSADGGAFDPLVPDLRVGSSAYALSAAVAGTLSPSYVTGTPATWSLQAAGAGGGFTFEAAYERPFGEVAEVGIDGGWSVGAPTAAGFSATANLAARTVDAGGTVGADTSVAAIAGRPAIAYRDLAGGNLKFARAGDAAGTSWPASSVVTVSGATTSTGFYASLAEVAGHPAIACYDASLGAVRYFRSADPAGLNWAGGLAVTVDGADANVGWYTSLAVVGGVPGIAYYDPNGGDLVFAWAADAAGASWPEANRVVVDGAAADVGQYASLAEVGGAPAVAYYDAGNADLKFARLDDGGDPADPLDWVVTVVDSAGAVGGHASLGVVGGRPAVAYHDAGNGALKFARAGDAEGATWPAGDRVTVDDGGASDVGRYASLAVAGGRPAVAYYDGTGRDLRFAWAGDADGSTWTAPVTVDGALAATDAGSHASLAAVGGLPVIAYHDGTTFDLRAATFPPASWTATAGGPLPALASGVKDGAIGAAQLADGFALWQAAGPDLYHPDGRVGVGRIPAANALEVEGNASKSTAGSWLANSDRRIKTDVEELADALEVIDRLRPVRFRYTDAYRAAHPAVGDREYLNFIAQEFGAVFPDDVSRGGDRTAGGDPVLQVDTYPATIYSVAAIQELHRMVRQKDAEIDELRARLEALERRLVDGGGEIE